MRKLIGMLKRYPASPPATAIRQHLAKPPSSRPGKAPSDTRVAIQCVPNALLFGLLASMAADIRRRSPADIDLVVVRSISAAFDFNLLSEIKRNAFPIWLLMSQWVNCFDVVAGRVACRSSSPMHPLSDAIAIWRSFRIWQRWRSARRADHIDLSSETLDDVVCGDLVTDTYLRFKPAPRFNVDDPFVWRLIWQALRDIHRARRYFRKHKPKIYLTSYATYIEHGIAVRIALQEGVSVYEFSNLNKFCTRLTLSHPNQTPDCSGYRETFERLEPSRQDQCLRRADDLLRLRLSGGTDPAIAYMRSSAYAAPLARRDSELSSELRGAVVIFLHDFYDSPHAYPRFIFTDFWEWVCCTIDTLDAASIPFFIKPHPNQIDLSDVALLDLARKYPKAKWLDRTTNNATLTEAPIACGVTAYGTVSHELAYLNVPSICSGSHPHESFDFCRTARSRQEYVALLRDYRHRCLSETDMRTQALQFYSIHNNLHDPVQDDLSSAFAKYFFAAVDAMQNDNSGKVVTTLDDLRKTRGYNIFVQSLVAGQPNTKLGEVATW